MSVTKDDALKLIYATLDDISAERGESSAIPLAPETRLIGSGRDLDSLEIVNLIVGLEMRLAERLGRSVVLVNEDAFGGGEVFSTADSLADHIVRLVQS